MKILPNDDNIKILYLSEALNDMTTSYKLFCLKGIIDEINIDNYEISFKRLAARMIQNVWYITLFDNVNLGKLDQLTRIVENTYLKYEIDSKLEGDMLFDKVLNTIDDKTVKVLMKYVIFRLIKPTFEEALKTIKSDNDKQKMIKELCKSSTKCLYRVDSENDRILINNCWFKYIKQHSSEVYLWINENIEQFISKRKY